MISIIIPNLHTPTVGAVVQALLRQTARAQIAEILVVVQDRYGCIPPEAMFIETPAPVAAAVARNIGATQAHSPYLLFLDLEAGAPWLLADNLLAFAAQLSTAPAGVQDFLPSFCLSIERAAFARLRGFDTRFEGAAGEDYDLSLRLRAAGYSLWFTPRARVSHQPGRSSARAVWRHVQQFGRSQVVLVHDHGLNSPLRRANARFAGLIVALAPIFALRDTLRDLWYTTLKRFPQLFFHYWFGKTAWYLGAGASLMALAHPDAVKTRAKAKS